MSNDKLERFPAADGIRGLAVLIVLVVHSMAMFFPKTYDGLAGSGKIGVWLFFILSSFLLTNNFIKNGFSFHSLISYFSGRMIRIIPLYLITVLIYCALGYFSIQDAYNLLKLNYPWGHLWTVAVEFKFYFLLPFISYVLIKSYQIKGRISLFICACVIIAIQQYFYPYYNVQPSSTDMFGYVSSFIPGMVAAVLLSKEDRHFGFIGTIISIIILAGILLSVPELRMLFMGVKKDGYLLNKHVHFSVLWGLFIYLTIRSKGIVNSLMCSAPLRMVGRWSFSIYLFHWLIYTQLIKNHECSYIFAICAPFIAIAIGFIIFVLIEKPLESLRHSVITKV